MPVSLKKKPVAVAKAIAVKTEAKEERRPYDMIAGLIDHADEIAVWGIECSLMEHGSNSHATVMHSKAAIGLRDAIHTAVQQYYHKLGCL